ncbi:uncharacterized protein DNG_05809 [Cephalotrichum gorgonifer]|uniref:LysM domain-containing protein n=1 Tax=Cephalotrichum gorgonifer TaxID=2041049 RepID=A0AAE8MYZ0_9PEZI|nr:uncharacterized protein DNG_05809 [Cephalotrichum gorgonifer]
MHLRTALTALLLSHGGFASPLSASPLANCEFIQINPSEGCDKLADRCGISPAEFERVNPKDSLCTTLRIGQRVCCTEGELPAIEGNPDGSCKQIEVERGDNCDKLAAECNVSLPELHDFNNATTEFCGALMPGQQVCCTPGELDADPEPQPPVEVNLNSTCKDYIVQRGDTCTSIASEFKLSGWSTVEEFNEGKTWGWRGCDKLFPDMAICVGGGGAPMPLPDQGAECGPRVPGTERPAGGVGIGDLNPCADGMCCSFYGSCGVTEEYCNWLL